MKRISYPEIAGICKIIGSTFARIHNQSVGLLAAAKEPLKCLVYFCNCFSIQSKTFFHFKPTPLVLPISCVFIGFSLFLLVGIDFPELGAWKE